jgi:hypothetical protein
MLRCYMYSVSTVLPQAVSKGSVAAANMDYTKHILFDNSCVVVALAVMGFSKHLCTSIYVLVMQYADAYAYPVQLSVMMCTLLSTARACACASNSSCTLHISSTSRSCLKHIMHVHVLSTVRKTQNLCICIAFTVIAGIAHFYCYNAMQIKLHMQASSKTTSQQHRRTLCRNAISYRVNT